MRLEEISNVCGVSGHEDAVRQMIIQAATPYADEVCVDTMGSVIALKRGRRQGQKVMLGVHMDEAGLICSGITEKGYLRFKTVGNIDSRYLISKRVVTQKGVRGVIGMKAIHLQKPEERKSITPVSSLFIDIGAVSKEEAEKQVSLGDYIYFDTSYRETEDGRIFLKAAASAAGCAVAVELLKEDCLYDTYFCFAAQHHTGARGMITAAYRIAPDTAFLIGGIESSDVHGVPGEQRGIRLSQGAAVSFMDRVFLADQERTDYLLKRLPKQGLKVQAACSANTVSDAGAVYTARAGIRTLFAGIPCRYLDTPVSCIDRQDLDAVKQLAYIFITDTEKLEKDGGVKEQ